MAYKGLVSQTFDERVTEFINARGRIVVDYSANPSTSSNYDMKAGIPTITIMDRDVAQTARATGVSYDQAYAQILVHELGHFVNSGLDSIKGALVSTLAEAKNFIFNREAEAAIFGAVITAEVRDNGGDFRVAGTSQINDLFTKVNSAMGSALASGVTDVFSAAVNTVSTYWAADPGYRAYADTNASAVLSAADRMLPTPRYEAQMGDSYSDYSGGCVEVGSVLPCGRLAGEIAVGDELALADEQSLSPSFGVVSYSVRKSAPGFRILTESGIELVCSDSAPIPVKDGRLLRPAGLSGQEVAVRDDTGGDSQTRWERVKEVQAIGAIEVQHVTVGDRSFWAGAQKGKYVLHHNMKMSDWGDDPFDLPYWWMTAGDVPAPDAAAPNYVTPSGQFDEFGRPLATLVGLSPL